MIQFFICLIVLTGLIEWYTVRDELRHLNFKSETDAHRVEPGKPFDVSVTVENTGRLPLGYIRAEVRYPKQMIIPMRTRPRDVTSEQIVDYSFSMKRRQKIRRTLTVSIEKRGCFNIRSARLYRGDFLGMNEMTQLFTQTCEVVVYPKRVGDENLMRTLTGLIGDIVSNRYLLQDPILTTGIREYVPGDPIRSISWKQSARRGKLMVREFEYTREEACRVILCLPDRERISDVLLDTCCGLVRSICEELVKKGINALFYTNAAMTGVYIERSYNCTADARTVDNLNAALGRINEYTTCRQEQLISDCLRGVEGRQEYIMVVPEYTETAARAAAYIEELTQKKVTVVIGEEYVDGRDL